MSCPHCEKRAADGCNQQGPNIVALERRVAELEVKMKYLDGFFNIPGLKEKAVRNPPPQSWYEETTDLFAPEAMPECTQPKVWP